MHTQHYCLTKKIEFLLNYYRDFCCRKDVKKLLKNYINKKRLLRDYTNYYQLLLEKNIISCME